MTREKAIEMILKDFHWGASFEQYVRNTVQRLVPDQDSIDRETISVIEDFIRNDIR